MKEPSKWFVSCNSVAGERLYIVARLKDKTEIQHSGNMEYYGEYSGDKEAQEKVAAQLNAEAEDTWKIAERPVLIRNEDRELLEMYILIYSKKRETDKRVWIDSANMHRENGREEEAKHAEDEVHFYENMEEALGRIMEALKL